MLKTSDTHPLRIDAFPLWSAEVGLTICPGKYQLDSHAGPWDRSLGEDVSALARWKAFAVVTLMEDHELDYLRVRDLPEAMADHFPIWLQLPITDRRAPDPEFLRRWRYLRLVFAHLLMTEANVVLHCMGGLGRSGTVAAMLCMDAGMSAHDAIRLVRQTRRGAIETIEQERFIENYRPDFVLTPESVRGALAIWSGAAGDALGYAVEFDHLDEIEARFGRKGIHPDRLPGTVLISDDTQMTLWAMAALADAGSADLRALRRGWLHWYEGQSGLPTTTVTSSLRRLASDTGFNARRAPGNTCLAALGNGARGTLLDPVNDSKGCGTVMRTAPIALIPDFSLEDRLTLAQQAAALTHGHPIASRAAAFLTGILHIQVAHHPSIDMAAMSLMREWPGLLRGYDSLISKALAHEDLRPDPSDYGAGWVAEEALAIGLAVARGDPLAPMSFVAATAANHDGDSDSTASIACQLAGSYRIPDPDFIDLVCRLDAFDAVADTLTAFYRVF